MKKTILLMLFISNVFYAQIYKMSILDTNQVSTSFHNRGGIGNHFYLYSLMWPRGALSLCYFYPSGLLIGGEVVNTQGDTLHIINDGFNHISHGDFEPATTNPWGWLPLPGYDNPSGSKVAISDDTTTWALTWQEWPGKHGNGVLRADLETYWVMNDSSNAEFNYYPIASDSSFRGLGLDVSCRGYQWVRPEFEDFIIFTYDITNVGDFPLTKLAIGFFSDPIIGGHIDYDDDLCNFNFFEDLVFCWDADGVGGGIQTGVLGFLTLDSPDQLGLTSAVAVPFGGYNWPKYDDKMWQFMKPGMDSICVQPTDFVLSFSSGYFSLDIGETKSYSIACVLGADSTDLSNNIMAARNAYDIITTINEINTLATPEVFRLGYNYPNPFNSRTLIRYELSLSTQVRLIVFDVTGKEVCTLIDERQNPGNKVVSWDGHDGMGNPVSSGIYFYRIEANGYYQSRKMILLK